MHSGRDVAPAPSAGVLYQEWATPRLDGAVYAEPLIVDGCLIVATENDTVYGFDAFSGRLRWRDHLAKPVPASALPCGDISPSGITGSPVGDASNATAWVSLLASTPHGPEHLLAEISLGDGHVLTRDVIDAPSLSPRTTQQRGALVLANGNVYVPFGGLFGGCGNYRGVLASVPAISHRAPVYWYPPATRGGGIWAPGGPDVLSHGRLLLAPGNGDYEPRTGWGPEGGVVLLSSSLRVVGSFSPTKSPHAAQMPDVGSTSPAVLADGLVVQVGTDGRGYVLSPGAKGGLRLASTVQVCPTGGAFGSDAVAGDTVYVACQAGLTAIAVTTRHARVMWRSSSAAPGSPVVAGGKVWLVTTTGQLEGIDPATGTVVQHMQLSLPEDHFPWLIADGATMYAPDGHKVIDLTGL